MKDANLKNIDLKKIIRPPTKEEMAILHENFVNRKISTEYAQTSMSYWWPKIKDLDVPQPYTICIPVKEEPMSNILDGKPIPKLGRMQQAVKKIGSPTFVRNNVMSGKHGWKKSCYLEKPDELAQHVYELTENMMSLTNGEIILDAMFFREFLDLEKTGFSCFYGDMPISKEVRCFVRNGTLECMHNYWFDEVFEREIEMHTSMLKSRKRYDKMLNDNGINHNNDIKTKKILPPNWRKKLAKSNTLTANDVNTILSHLSKITPHFNNYWSIDFTKGVDGKWYLIDMARGEVSFHIESCKNNPSIGG